MKRPRSLLRGLFYLHPANMERNHKYRRNGTIGLVAGLSAGGVACVIIQLLHIANGISELNKITKPSASGDIRSYIILTDSAGKKDTLLLTDYLEKNKQLADSSTSPAELLTPK
jgi:hypothetical protein